MFEKKRRENPEKYKTKTQPNSQPRQPSPLHFSSFPGQPNRPAQTSVAAQLFLPGLLQPTPVPPPSLSLSHGARVSAPSPTSRSLSSPRSALPTYD